MDSILTKYTDFCAFCGRPTTETHHLLIGPARKRADQDGLTLPVCSNCHTMAEPLMSLHKNMRKEQLQMDTQKTKHGRNSDKDTENVTCNGYALSGSYYISRHFPRFRPGRREGK